MIATPPEMRELTHELTVSTWTLAAIGALFESDLVDHLREPRSADDLATRCPALAKSHIERTLGVAAAVGVVKVEGGLYQLAPGVVPLSQPPFRTAMQGDIRTHLMQVLAFLDSATAKAPNPGWRHTDRALLQAQGDASAQFAPIFKMQMLAALGDLAARLEQPGARFLDVGVGVASLAIGMCRTFPGVSVVGLDTYDVPLAIARENVTRAGLGERIELRQVAVQDLRDEQAFEAAWLPAFFIPEAVIPEAMARVHASLRPGGWVLLPVSGAGGIDRQRAVAALMTELWGGTSLSHAAHEALLKEAGFSAVKTMAGPPWAPALIVGQR
jgi:hypothetical protein